jgi:hypothetical protein
MGAQGKAFTFIQKDQGEELTRIENLINMVLQQATLEGFESTPPPRDWEERRPGAGGFEPAAPKPVVSRFERPYGASSAPTAVATPATGGESPIPGAQTPVPLPRRTIGSKIPITRRHKRRR